MPHEEMGFGRDGIYSAWHRRYSLERYLGIDAESFHMIDIDAWIEYRPGDKQAVALMETARDNGQDIKPASVIRNLASRVTPIMPAYLVLYTPSHRVNPAWPTVPDIAEFRVKRLWPTPENEWTTYEPLQWAQRLQNIREWGSRKWPLR